MNHLYAGTPANPVVATRSICGLLRTLSLYLPSPVAVEHAICVSRYGDRVDQLAGLDAGTGHVLGQQGEAAPRHTRESNGQAPWSDAKLPPDFDLKAHGLEPAL